jgi:hypothetical protein
MPLTTIYGDGTRVIGSTSQPLLPQPLHPQVANYVGRVVAAGYAMSRVEIDAINNLILGMVANGIYDKCDLIYPVIGSSTATVGFDLKNSFNATFTGSWTVASTGMRPTTASIANRADTTWNPSVNGNGANDHLSIYLRTNQTTDNVPIGCFNNVTFFQANATISASGNMVINNTPSGAMIVSGISTSAGYWVGTRTAAAVQRAFINNIQRGSSAITTTTRPNLNVFLGTRNRGGGSYDFPSSSEIAFVSIGDGLTNDEVRHLNLLVQAYQTKLGRQV